MRVGGIDYGAGAPWEIDVPDSATVVEGPDPEKILPPLADPAAAVREAIANPHGTEPLAEHIGRLDGKSKITIAINDMTAVSAVAMPVVLEELAKGGVLEENVTIVPAGGMHPKLRRTELYLSKLAPPNPPPFPSPWHVLPPDVIDRFWPTISDTSRIRSHDCVDDDHLVDLGVTEYGDLVEMNDCLVNSDFVIYMAGSGGNPNAWGGYLGGGVGIAAGLASARSIMTHHCVRVVDHPDSYTGEARKHLLRKHKESVAAVVEEKTGKQVFYIESVLNANKQFAAMFAGSATGVREPIFDLVDNEKTVELPHQFDIVVSGSPLMEPYDTCHNPVIAMEQLTRKVRLFRGDKPPLREGGIAILVTPCNGTVQESRSLDGELLELYARLGCDPDRLSEYEEAFGHREDLLYRYRWEYGYHPYHSFIMFYDIAYLQKWAGRVIFAGADARAAGLVGATGTATWKDAWDLACKTLGTRDPSVLVLPRATAHLPVVWDVK